MEPTWLNVSQVGRVQSQVVRLPTRLGGALTFPGVAISPRSCAVLRAFPPGLARRHRRLAAVAPGPAAPLLAFGRGTAWPVALCLR